eukprot:26835-Prymnesium_polylepis.3
MSRSVQPPRSLRVLRATRRPGTHSHDVHHALLCDAGRYHNDNCWDYVSRAPVVSPRCAIAHTSCQRVLWVACDACGALTHL